jgi:THO complex subunit 2
MTGLEPFADLSDGQVMSLAGGKILRSEVFNQTDLTQVSGRQGIITTNAAKGRLVASLKQSGLAIPLLVNIAIQRQACLSDTEVHLKALGGLFDAVSLSFKIDHSVLKSIFST